MNELKAKIPDNLLSDNAYELNKARKEIEADILHKRAEIIDNVYKEYLGGKIKPKDHYRMGIKREAGTLKDELYLDNRIIGCIICEWKDMAYTIKFEPK